MNRIDKALFKIPKDYREKIFKTLLKIEDLDFKNLDIKKLKGSFFIYRVRIGIYRIQFRLENKKVFILDIAKRNENIYK